MSVYKDPENNPFIYDWADADDKVNRWMVYQIEKELLRDYVNGLATHSQILNSPKNDILFIVDIDNAKEIINCITISPTNLPYDYLPDNDIKFEKEESRGLDNICRVFNLDKLTKEYEKKSFDRLKELYAEIEKIKRVEVKKETDDLPF